MSKAGIERNFPFKLGRRASHVSDEWVATTTVTSRIRVVSMILKFDYCFSIRASFIILSFSLSSSPFDFCHDCGSEGRWPQKSHKRHFFMTLSVIRARRPRDHAWCDGVTG